VADAVVELTQLRERRARAARRVAELEREWRSANEQAAQASARLAEVERQGASAAARHKAEEALSEAKALAAQPWAERVDGAKRAVRDVDVAVRAHVSGHLVELVEALEADGRAVAERINAAAADLVAAHAEWEAVATELGATIAMVSPPGPLDVSRSQAEQAARAVAALVAAGGQEGPRVSRLNDPWARLLAEPVDELDEVEAVA
jgi:hypothetical protein